MAAAKIAAAISADGFWTEEDALDGEGGGGGSISVVCFL